MVWNRGGRDDYDTWEALGNPGWGWNSLLPYFKKVKELQVESEGEINYFR